MNTPQVSNPKRTDADLAEFMEQEVALRRREYTHSSKWTEDQKRASLSMLQAVADRLRTMDQSGALFKEVWAAFSQAPAGPTGEVAFYKAAAFLQEGPADSREQLVTLAALTLRMLSQFERPQTAADVNSGSPAACATAGQNIRVKTAGPTKYATPAAVRPVPPTHSLAPGRITGPTGAGYATPEQKETIISLLNHPAIQLKEKTKILLNINKLDPERADKEIERLKKLADDYEGPVEVDGLRKALRSYIEQNREALGVPEADRLEVLCEDPAATASLLRDNLRDARKTVGEAVAA